MNPIHVKSADGSMIEVTASEWPLLASAARSTFERSDPAGHPEYLDRELMVRMHADGRHLIYGTIERGRERIDSRGSILPADAHIESELRSIAREMQLDDYQAENCLRQLRSQLQ
jgi:hypothetical protein